MPPAGTRCTHSDSFTGYPGTFQYTTPMGFLISDPQAASCKNAPPGVLYGDYRLSMPSGMTALTLTFAFAIHQGLIPSYGASFEWEPAYYTTFDTSSDSGIPGNRFKNLATHCIAPQVYTEFFEFMYYTNGLQWRMIIYSPSLSLGYKL